MGFKFHGKDHIYFFHFDEINRLWKFHSKDLQTFWMGLIDSGYEFSAHNAFFERCIYENILVRRYGWPLIPAKQYRCTAAKAAACALPRSLENAGAALKLPIQKDREGYVVMMATCMPTKEWKAWAKSDSEVWSEPKMFREPEDHPDVFEKLYDYCKKDVLAEEALDNALRDLKEDEQEIWHLNQEMNWRGLRFDLPIVMKIVSIIESEGKKKLKELDSLTMGLVTKPGARQSILDFLALEGIELPNLRAKTVEDKLQGFELSDDMHRLLEIRKALSLTSTKKYQSFLNRANEDGRIRDILLYHGASTGRDTGTGVQPHNFPKGLIRVDEDRPYAAVENVIECDPEMLKILYGDSLGLVFSAILRNMIIPSEGCELFVGDYSMIEVAILWWLADNVPGLKILRAGMDPYKYMASSNTGKPYQEVPDKGDDRQLGKAQVLGCGFGMGWEKFLVTAWEMHRLKLTEEQAKNAVQSYRSVNSAVPVLWKAYENAAIQAVEEGEGDGRGHRWSMVDGRRRGCHFFVRDKFLWVQLPSGRRLAYREPQISWRETEYGARKTLEFWAVNSKTKKWSLERTWGGTLTENIVQATARDLLMPAMVRLEKAGYKALLTVHDEGICERPIGEGNVEEFIQILTEVPSWATGCPINAKGWKGPRYRK
jgi:DNA polymerase bacteriophage-type